MRWTLTYPARPWSGNEERRHSHWAWRAGQVKEWRTAFWVLAKEQHIPRCERVSIDVSVEATSRRSMADPGACWGAVKAAVDGLVDAKVIADDTGEQVAWYRLWPPCVTGRDALTLIVAEVER